MSFVTGLEREGGRRFSPSPARGAGTVCREKRFLAGPGAQRIVYRPVKNQVEALPVVYVRLIIPRAA